MTALAGPAGRAASWSRGVKAATRCGLGLLPRWRGVCRSVRMENGSSQSGRGALIVLEGLDRSGKSSQCARLLSFLQGKGCQAEGWRFPDRSTSVGQMISAYLANESELDDRTVHLLFSANRWEKRASMERKLLGGTTLIVDRYSYSGVAFSAAKGLDIEWCKAPEIGLVAPDLVVYLDVQPEKAAERGDYGAERYEKIEFQKKVGEHYHSLRDSTWKVVDASLPMEVVEEQLRELAMSCILESQGKQLANLAW
ncbi:thymidylate kinase isoform X1 [Oryza brachyantha]|uniref:Thymidylate kinase n=2 Tax=Oryza brachyantha TaxID=4533 RepID=J3MNF9_ORYBR|nr:thymidylate kinase isoform X1 [Oryza brachyantha]XP_015695128.1 thymidylate kinase isoform X1 [Oryza brachyantha]XP_015695129.1 thymidylate kinase isoform X1 [Oryza brachyantha]